MFSCLRSKVRSLSPRVVTRLCEGSRAIPLSAGCAQFLLVFLVFWSMLLNSSAFPQQPSASSKKAVPQIAAGVQKKTGKSAPSADPGSRISFEELIEKSGIRFQLKRSEEHTSELQSLRHLVC